MQTLPGSMMKTVATILRVLIVINALCLLLFAGFLVLSFAGEAVIAEAVRKGQPGAAVDQAVAAIRLVMVIGLVMVPLAHVLLTRLRLIVETVRAGDPFVPVNAQRLTVIAWSLLGIQLADLAFGYVSVRSHLDPWGGWTFSTTGWIAVLLLFVLARVFAHGTRMRDELAGLV